MRKCDFCRLFHTERSWHAYWFSAVIVSGRRDLPGWFVLWCKNIHCGWKTSSVKRQTRRPVYKRLFKSNRVLRADQKSDVNQTCKQSVFSPMGACISIWCTSGAVERQSQMFVYRLSPFPFSLPAIFFTLSPNRDPLHGLSQTRSTYSNILHDLLPMLFLVFVLTSRKCRKGRSTNSIG